MSIVLRKYRGELAAMLRSRTTRSFAPGAGSGAIGAVLALFASPLATVVLALAFVLVRAFTDPGALDAAPLLLVGQVSNAVVEKREKFAAKQKELGEVFDMAKDGNVYDFSRKTVLEKLGATDSGDAVAKVKARNVELDNLGSELQQAELKEIQDAIGERETARSTPVRSTALHPAPTGSERKTFGQLFAESKAYVEGWRKNRQIGLTSEVDVDVKTLFERGAGFAPESQRTGLLVEAVTRPVQVLDLMPTRPIQQAVDKYMEETTRTHAAAEKAEGTAYAESTFVWTERTQPVEKITDSIPVTDEQLEDESQVASILDQRLRFGLRQRLDLQVLVGDGTPPNLLGINVKSGTQTQAKGADPVFDAVFKGLTKVRFTGRAIPNALIFHPNDWQDVRLTRTADGLYIMGNPATPGPMTLFGLPVALSDAQTENTTIVGDFLNFCYVGERRGIDVQIGYVADQFKEGKRTIRADLRACFTITRAAAFCKITGM